MLESCLLGGERGGGALPVGRGWGGGGSPSRRVVAGGSAIVAGVVASSLGGWRAGCAAVAVRKVAVVSRASGRTAGRSAAGLMFSSLPYRITAGTSRTTSSAAIV